MIFKDSLYKKSLAQEERVFDVVTCCPTHHNSSTNLCRNAAAMPGKAAGDGELHKRKKWLHHCQAMDLLFVPLAHENGGRMGEAARKFLDRLVLRVGGTASERARYRCYAEQRLARASADGAARLVLSFKNHIRRRGGTVARTATDLRLPQPSGPGGTRKHPPPARGHRRWSYRDHYCSCLPKFYYWGPRDPGPPGHPGGLARWVIEFRQLRHKQTEASTSAQCAGAGYL